VAHLGRPAVGVQVAGDPAVVHERDAVGLGRGDELAERLRPALPLVRRVLQASHLAPQERPHRRAAIGDLDGREERFRLDEVDRLGEHDGLRDEQVVGDLRPERRVHHHLGAAGDEVGEAGHAYERFLGRALDRRAGDLPRDGPASRPARSTRR
jgi:hypothetical protein